MAMGFSSESRIMGVGGKLGIMKASVLALSATIDVFMDKDPCTEKQLQNIFVGAGANINIEVSRYAELFASGFAEYCVSRKFGHDYAFPLSFGAEAGIFIYPKSMDSYLAMGASYSYRKVDQYKGGLISVSMRIKAM